MIPMELGWLHCDRETFLLQQLTYVGPQTIGYPRWRRDVIAEVGILKAAFDVNDFRKSHFLPRNGKRLVDARP
jgi:hypothetical protein